MRILCVLFTLLVITVTSLARPQEAANTNNTTTAVPLTSTIKNNDSPSGTPASMGKSNEKPNNAIVYTTPSVTTAEKLKENIKLATALTKTAVTPAVTSNSKTDLSSAITSSDKITSTTTTTTTNTTSTTTAAPPKTSTTTTTTASPTTEIVTTNNINIVSTSANTTTAIPVAATTSCPPSDRHFDGLSFLGGIILTICLIGIGIFLCKYCQHVCEDKYRTL